MLRTQAIREGLFPDREASVGSGSGRSSSSSSNEGIIAGPCTSGTNNGAPVAQATSPIAAFEGSSNLTTGNAMIAGSNSNNYSWTPPPLYQRKHGKKSGPCEFPRIKNGWWKFWIDPQITRNVSKVERKTYEATGLVEWVWTFRRCDQFSFDDGSELCLLKVLNFPRNKK